MKGTSMFQLRHQWTGAALVAASVALGASLSSCTWWQSSQATVGAEIDGEARTGSVASVVSPTLKLDVLFYQRLLVPPGGTLAIVVTDSAGTEVGSATAMTGDGPPYRIEVPLARSSHLPVTVSVTLTSVTGHILTGEEAFTTVPPEYTEFEIAVGGA
jgi:hypothetical protein